MHIGYSRIVFKEDLIGIFHMNLQDNPINKQYLESSTGGDFYCNSDLGSYKSFIVTSNSLFFSPVVPATLARRDKSSGIKKGQV
ncbi:MAG: DUF370 domain-containing protein [Firmicutes bacterium]|nr:DUF370 domain-containing protein [Bacillota bacterium]